MLHFLQIPTFDAYGWWIWGCSREKLSCACQWFAIILQWSNEGQVWYCLISLIGELFCDNWTLQVFVVPLNSLQIFLARVENRANHTLCATLGDINGRLGHCDFLVGTWAEKWSFSLRLHFRFHEEQAKKNYFYLHSTLSLTLIADCWPPG